VILRRQSRKVVLILAALVAVVLLGGTADAGGQAYRVIYDFGYISSDGWFPVGIPALAKNGDLYGVTHSGGTYNWGTVYKLTAPRTRGGTWIKTILYDFPSNSQEYPASLVIGEDGALYGTGAGPSIRGFIFRLTPPSSGDGPWMYQTLYTFQSSADGNGPEGNLVFDAAGNLYGATQAGGDLSCGQNGGCGTVFELKRPTKSGGKWRFSVLYTFTGTPDGAEPFAGVTIDQNGNLYGTTNYDGANMGGALYRVSPPKKKGRPWTETVLYSFEQGVSGDGPEGPVIFDSSGNLYGTTAYGGDLNCQGGVGCGVVFELSPPATKGGAWSYATLHAFQDGNDGAIPSGYLVFDSQGSLYGTTKYGGEATEGGSVYQVKPPAHKGGTWTETVLHAFTGNNGDGALPVSGLTWGKWNYLYGVTAEGGSACQAPGCGTAFELRP